MGEELSCGQAQNEVKFNFQVQSDLEGHSRSPLKFIRILTRMFCISDLYLVILAWTAVVLSCGQVSDWYIHTHICYYTEALSPQTAKVNCLSQLVCLPGCHIKFRIDPDIKVNWEHFRYDPDHHLVAIIILSRTYIAIYLQFMVISLLSLSLYHY